MKHTIQESFDSTDPIVLFSTCFADAKATEPFDASACVLSTAVNNIPSSRYVLMKGVDEKGFSFFTNYESQKAREIEANPNACLCFHWHTQGLQIRVQGQVYRTSAQDSDLYFATRPKGSQAGAWASKQSAPLASREMLESSYEQILHEHERKPIARPPFWGGYVLTPRCIEFWYNGEYRLHDRVRFKQTKKGWTKERLYP